MPLLGTFLFNVFSALAAWLVKYFTQKMAVAVALIAIVSGLLVLIYASLRLGVNLAMAGAASMHPMFAAGVSVVISPTAQQCITAYLALWSLCELLKWKFNILQLWSRTI
jgi:hypothetical protein